MPTSISDTDQFVQIVLHIFVIFSVSPIVRTRSRTVGVTECTPTTAEMSEQQKTPEILETPVVEWTSTALGNAKSGTPEQVETPLKVDGNEE
jgi:hypothetical protein